MKRRSFVRMSGVLGLSGLLGFAPGQAQQKQLGESVALIVAENDAMRFESSSLAFTAKATATPDEKVSASERAETNNATSGANVPAPASGSLAHPAPLALSKDGKLTPLEKAYLDAFSILKQDNSCSRFYGGPGALEVLNELTRQIKPTYFDRNVALRMSGLTSSAISQKYGLPYRVFEKAELNLNGPFYTGKYFDSELRVPNIGIFQPNTRGARITILLHELGHMIRKSNRQWLLPNDGGDIHLSRQNTMQVIAVCGEQIRSLGKAKAVQQLVATESEGERDAKNGTHEETSSPGF